MSEITAHVDENQNNSIIGVQGTLGTADTKGTAPTLPIGVSPVGAMYTAATDGTTGLTATIEARKQTPTGNALNVQIGPGDVISNIPVVTLFEHHQVHEGEAHDYEYYSANPATMDFAIVVPTYSPTIDAPHLLIGLQSYGGASMISLYEAGTYTGGTPGLIYNRNRNSAIVPKSGFSIQEGVTVTAAGTKLPYTIIVGAAEKVSGSDRALSECILKSNTIYILRYEEITPTTRLIITLNWYEDLGV